MRLFYELHGKRFYSLIIKKNLGKKFFYRKCEKKLKGDVALELVKILP